MNELTPAPVLHCANCAAILEGPFCHACGQSVKSVLRPMSAMFEDTMDIVFHVDERIMHTLPPLFLKPGYLTLEYFAGRRVRYVAPFRLMFVFCLLAFFAVHLAMNVNGEPGAPGTVATDHDTGKFATDATAEAVQARLAEVEKAVKEGKADASVPAIGKLALDAGEEEARSQANRRLAQLNAAANPSNDADDDAPAAAGTAPHKPKRWATKLGDAHVSSFPAFINNALNRSFQHAAANMDAMAAGDVDAKERFFSGLFGVLPQTMFILLPIFALLLKLVYVFRRRLYMEHVIVSLHSHAFLFLSVLILVLLMMLANLVRPHVAWVAGGIGYLELAVWIWMPIYLLLTQKRVYRQGWFKTVLKYLFAGWCYAWMLTFALLIAAAISLSH